MTRPALGRTVVRVAATTLAMLISASAGTAASASGPAVGGASAPAPIVGHADVLGASIAGVIAPRKDVSTPTPTPPVPTPPVPTGLPAGIEPLSDYIAQSSCEPTDKPGSVAFGQLLKKTYPNTSFGVARGCTVRMASEHYDGRAIDWMNHVRDPKKAAQAAALINWLFAKDAAGNPYANARRLGIMYMIWNGKIWGSYNAAKGWEWYNDCAKHPEPASDNACHRDHIHFSLSWAGAMKRTSYWTRKVAAQDYGPCRPTDLNWAPPYAGANPKPCRRQAKIPAPPGASPTLVELTKFSGAYFAPGQNGPGVTVLQKALNVEQAGTFGPKTTEAVRRFKSARRLSANAVVDGPTWRALLAALKSSATKPAASPAKASNPLTPYRNTVLRYNAKGAAVTALQKALKVSPTSGWFGPLTRAAVQAFQRAKKLPVTGVVDARTWKALGA